MRRLFLLPLTLVLISSCTWFSRSTVNHPRAEPRNTTTHTKPPTRPPSVPLAVGSPNAVFDPILPALEKTVRIPLCLPAKVPSIGGGRTYYLNYVAEAHSYSVSLYENSGQPLPPNQAPTDDPQLTLIGRLQGEENPTASVNPLPEDLPVLRELPVAMAPGIVGHMVYVGQGGPPEWGYLTWPDNRWLFAVGASGPGWWIRPDELVSQGRYTLREYRNRRLPPDVDRGSLFFSFAEHRPSTITWRWGSYIYKGEANSWQAASWVASLVRIGS